MCEGLIMNSSPLSSHVIMIMQPKFAIIPPHRMPISEVSRYIGRSAWTACAGRWQWWKKKGDIALSTGSQITLILKNWFVEGLDSNKADVKLPTVSVLLNDNWAYFEMIFFVNLGWYQNFFIALENTLGKSPTMHPPFSKVQ